LRNLLQTSSGTSLVRGTRHIAHWALHIAHWAFGRLRSLQVDPQLDESIELRQRLGTSLKTLRTRSEVNAQCPMPNEQ
jgi:hypothetical protein